MPDIESVRQLTRKLTVKGHKPEPKYIGDSKWVWRGSDQQFGSNCPK